MGSKPDHPKGLGQGRNLDDFFRKLEDDKVESTAVVSGEVAGRGEATGGEAPAGKDGGSRKRPPRRKTVNVDGVRTVNYYRFTEHELDFVSEPLAEAARAKAIAAFALGLLINAVVSFSFGKPSSDAVWGVWVTIGVGSFVAAIYYYFFEFKRLRAAGKTRLERIKDEHDFGE